MNTIVEKWYLPNPTRTERGDSSLFISTPSPEKLDPVLADRVQMWRKHAPHDLWNIHPQYLPEAWSVERTIKTAQQLGSFLITQQAVLLGMTYELYPGFTRYQLVRPPISNIAPFVVSYDGNQGTNGFVFRTLVPILRCTRNAMDQILNGGQSTTFDTSSLIPEWYLDRTEDDNNPPIWLNTPFAIVDAAMRFYGNEPFKQYIAIH